MAVGLRWDELRAVQKYDPELVKDALRPVVFEEVRVDVDDEMRVLLTNLKEMVAAEKAAKSGKKGKKGKKGARKTHRSTHSRFCHVMPQVSGGMPTGVLGVQTG